MCDTILGDKPDIGLMGDQRTVPIVLLLEAIVAHNSLYGNTKPVVKCGHVSDRPFTPGIVAGLPPISAL